MLGVAAKHLSRGSPCLAKAAGALSSSSVLDRLRLETDTSVTSSTICRPFTNQQMSFICTSSAVHASRGRGDDKRELRRRMDERLGERAKPGLSEDIIQEVETAAETEAPAEVEARAAGHVGPENVDAGTEGEMLQGAGLDPGTSSPESSEAAEVPTRKPIRVYVHEPTPIARPDPRLGYSAIGIPPVHPTGPDDPGRPGQLNSRRIFYPSQTYNSADLAVTEAEVNNVNRDWSKKKVNMPSNTEVMEKADFRNLAFLSQYVTEMGKLIPRRKTRLQQKVQRHLCRQIKTARSMALLPPLAKLFEFDTAAQQREKRMRQEYGDDVLDSGDDEDDDAFRPWNQKPGGAERRQSFVGKRGNL